MTRIITVTGGKGGVGKTNISINLALILSKLGSKVCLFDADLGLANINILLGLYPEYDLEDVILSNKSIHDIIIKNYQGIDIIPGSSGVEKLANLSGESLDRLIESFSTIDDYDYFIFDTSAGISRNVISFCLAASDVLLVITPEPTSLTDAYALLKILCFNGFTGSVKIIVNQCRNTSAASAAYTKLRDAV
ncbi:MAG: AAA family ATPase, partial [Pseudomonadota bacterium]